MEYHKFIDLTLSGSKELGLEGFDKTADKYFDKGYDKLHKHRHRDDDRQRDSNGKDNMSDPQGRDRGYDNDSDDSYNERPRRRRPQRDDRDDKKPRQYNDRDDRDDRDEDRKPRRYSPPGQSYHPRASDTQPQYQPYQPHAAYQPGNTRQKDAVPPNPPYYNDSSRPSSRDYTPTSSSRGPQRNELARYSRPKSRSPSRHRRRRSPSSSRSRSRSTSRSRDFTDSPLMALDRTPLGLGAGLAGALLGGYIGRETSDNHRHQKRSTALGAIIGGIGANILENRVRIYREEMKEEQREAKVKWEARHGSEGGGKERRGRRDEDRY
ncbi:hypothetical protein D6D15_04210 [Aureobasidium pullulans]|uniref:Glycine zipper 2TM domain-containing protein n=1 Tax=Aureobasidium pullulans TaxID=5580 RepID=A0A4S9BCP6_AURPU|nr:hypothetical protein D6D15_04210 [Aureobasidium pullulans]